MCTLLNISVETFPRGSQTFKRCRWIGTNLRDAKLSGKLKFFWGDQLSVGVFSSADFKSLAMIKCRTFQVSKWFKWNTIHVLLWKIQRFSWFVPCQANSVISCISIECSITKSKVTPAANNNKFYIKSHKKPDISKNN